MNFLKVKCFMFSHDFNVRFYIYNKGLFIWRWAGPNDRASPPSLEDFISPSHGSELARLARLICLFTHVIIK